jgi:hypothetical protein
VGRAFFLIWGLGFAVGGVDEDGCRCWVGDRKGLVRIFGGVGRKRRMVFWVLDADIFRILHENCVICIILLVFCVSANSWYYD